MTTESIEQRLQKLEEGNKKLEEENQKFKLELERTRAVHEILNIMGRLQAYHTVGKDGQIQALFSKRSDNRVYFGELGFWESVDASDRAGAGMANMSHVGYMPIHLMANPVIEVAADGQTAQAIFVASGARAMKDRETGKPMCVWEWNRYGDDFIKEDGQWKLWHHHVYPLFNAGWDDKWEVQFAPRESTMPLPFKPDYPATSLDVGYDPDAELPLIPIPKPYETWNPKQIY